MTNTVYNRYGLEYPGLDATDEEVKLFKAEIIEMDKNQTLLDLAPLIPFTITYHEFRRFRANITATMGDAVCHGGNNIAWFNYDLGDCCLTFTIKARDVL